VPELVQRVPVTRITIGASAAATCFATVVAANALSSGPTLQQRELLREMLARHGRSPRADGTAVRGAPPPREEVVRPQRTMKGKGTTHSFPLSTYSALGGLRQDPGRAVKSPAGARTCGNGSREMRVLLSAYGSRGDVEPVAGLAVRSTSGGALLVMATRFVTSVQAPRCAQWLQASSDRS